MPAQLLIPECWPPQRGDLFFVHDNTLLGETIMGVQAFWSRQRGEDGISNFSHCGLFLDDARVFETTPGKTQVRDFAVNYAGSGILLARLKEMTDERHYTGLTAVADQLGMTYPVGRLLAHLLGIERFANTPAKECSWLVASYLKGAGFPIQDDPESYDACKLPDEVYGWYGKGLADIYFLGSMRAAGLVTGSGPDNVLVAS